MALPGKGSTCRIRYLNHSLSQLALHPCLIGRLPLHQSKAFRLIDSIWFHWMISRLHIQDSTIWWVNLSVLCVFGPAWMLDGISYPSWKMPSSP
jgi:hypothetical protein